MSVIFLSGPIGAGKTTVAKALLPLLPAPLAYIEGDTFWSFIRKDEGAITDRAMLERFISDDEADPVSLAHRIVEDLDRGHFRVV